MENLLSEAFQKLSLLENDFDFSTVDKDKADELSAFIADDVDFIPEEPIIDVNAKDETQLADNYIGKVILECECCHSRIYKNEEDVVIDDEAGVANIEEACPVCNNSLGYSVIGKIEAFDSDREIEPEENEEEIPYEAPEVEEEPEEEIEDEEDKDESLKNSKLASEDSKKLDEAHLPLADRLARKHLNSLTNPDVEEGFDNYMVKGEDPAELAMEGEAGEMPEDDIDEKLNSEEAARMAEITKDGIVHPEDKDEYNDLHKKDKEVEEGCDESLKNSDLASEDSKKLDESEDVCPECGKNPCICEGCHEEELEEACEEEIEEELPADDLPDPWGEGVDESLQESVELHTDGEPVDLVKNDDGSISLEVGASEPEELVGEPIEAPEEPAGTEEIVPLDAEEQNAIEANEPEDEFAEEPAFEEEPLEDEFAEEPIEDEEEEEGEFESLESSDKPVINESAKETNTIQDKIAKETLKQAKIETKMMQLDLAAKQAEAEAVAPVEEPVEDIVDEEPIEDEVPEEVEESLDSDLLEDITDLDEATFDHICEAYMRRVYENVDTFKTSKVLVGENKAVIEGVINFVSGKTKNTVFTFANPQITKRGKLVMEGFNTTFTDRADAFTVKFKFDNTNLVAESMVYDYTSNQLNESNEQEVIRVYGRVKA